MANPKERQKINLMVDGHRLSLEVVPSEESLYRRATEAYNSRVNKYRARYTSDVDYPRLMAAIDMALQLEVCKQRLDDRPMEQELQRLCDDLGAYLKDIDGV